MLDVTVEGSEQGAGIVPDSGRQGVPQDAQDRQGSQGSTGVDPRESVSNAQTQAIQKELDSILNDKKSLYWNIRDPKDPERLKIVDRVNTLRNALAGEQSHAVKDKLAPEDQVTSPIKNAPAEWSREAEMESRQIAAAAGVSADMVSSFAQAVADGGIGAQYPDAEACEAALRIELKEDFDATLFEARFAYRQLGPELQELMEKHALGNNSVAIKQLAELGHTMIEAQENISNVRKDTHHPYWNTADPLHAAAVEDMRLWESALAPFRRNVRRA